MSCPRTSNAAQSMNSSQSAGLNTTPEAFDAYRPPERFNLLS
jgi:hypothetical protein